MKQLSQTDISQNLQRLIEVADNPSRKEIERMTDMAGVKVTSTTLGNFLNEPEERSPWIKTILTLAYVLRAEPWWLMVKNFPIKEVKDLERRKGKLPRISADGYALLHAFETAPNDMARYAMLEAVKQAVSVYSDNSSNLLAEAQSRYIKHG